MNYLWWRKVDICSGFKVWVWSLWYPNRNWGWFHDGFFLPPRPLSQMYLTIFQGSLELMYEKLHKVSKIFSFSRESFFNFWKAVRGADPLSPIRGQADLSPSSNLYGFFTWGFLLLQKYRTSHMKPWNDCLGISTLAAAILFFFNLPAQGDCQ